MQISGVADKLKEAEESLKKVKSLSNMRESLGRDISLIGKTDSEKSRLNALYTYQDELSKINELKGSGVNIGPYKNLAYKKYQMTINSISQEERQKELEKIQKEKDEILKKRADIWNRSIDLKNEYIDRAKGRDADFSLKASAAEVSSGMSLSGMTIGAMESLEQKQLFELKQLNENIRKLVANSNNGVLN
jgi:hypothetical protein